MPYIKSEPDELDLNNGYTNFNSNQNFSFQNNFNGGVDPSELSMGQNYNFAGHGMSNSYIGGGGSFIDDDLLNDMSPAGQLEYGHNMPNGQMNNIYSHTPDGAPIQSPFVGGFDYSQFSRMNSIPQHMSPHQSAFMNKRPSIQAQGRKPSHNAPMTPRTAAMASLHIGTPEQNGRPIRAPNSGSRHQKTMSGQFDGTPGSAHSVLDSPLSSPSNLAHHSGYIHYSHYCPNTNYVVEYPKPSIASMHPCLPKWRIRNRKKPRNVDVELATMPLSAEDETTSMNVSTICHN